MREANRQEQRGPPELQGEEDGEKEEECTGGLKPHSLLLSAPDLPGTEKKTKRRSGKDCVIPQHTESQSPGHHWGPTQLQSKGISHPASTVSVRAISLARQTQDKNHNN